MKRQTFIMMNFVFVASLIVFVTRAQTPDELLSKTWQFKMLTTVTESSILGIPVVPANAPVASRGYQFRVVNILNNGTLIIKFLKWPVSSAKNAAGASVFPAPAIASTNAFLNESFYMMGFIANYFTAMRSTYYRYFIISRADFDSRCEEKSPKNQFSVGASTLPIKIRFGKKNPDGTYLSHSSFTGNVSLGLSFGLRHNHTKSFAMNYLAGFSLTSVPVSSETTKGFVQNETNQAAITWHAGVLATINNFQIGVFSGIDYLSGKINKEWVYKNKPWLGIGIGYSFFNPKKTTDTQQ